MNQRNPDIEIYIKRVAIEDVLAWLGELFEIGTPEQRGETIAVALRHGGADFTCVVFPNAVKGGYVSVCFEPNNTPWDDDEACAIQAFEHFQLETRCSTGGWTTGAEDQGGWYRFTLNDSGVTKTVVNWLA